MAITPTTARRTVEAFSVSHAAILDGTAAANETDLYGVRTASLTPDVGNADNTGDDAVLSSWFWFNFANLSVESGYISFDQYAKMTGTVVEVGGTPTSAAVTFTPNAAGGGDAFDYTTNPVNITIDGTAVALDSDYTNLAGVVTEVDTALAAGYTVTADAGAVRIEKAPGAGSIVIAGADAADIVGGAGYTNTAGADSSEISVPLWQEDAANQPPWPTVVRMPSRDAVGAVWDLDILLYKVQYGPITFQGPAYKTGLAVSYPGRVLTSAFDEKGQAIVGKKRCGRLISRTQVA